MNEYNLLSLEPTTELSTVNPLMFDTANEFSMYIEKRAIETGVPYMDVVLQFCEENLLEPEDVASKINKSLKAKIENEFRELNYLPKVAQIEF